MQPPVLVFAYFGPETVMPMTSILATVAALVMMFGRIIFRFTLGRVWGAWYRMRGRNTTPAPHFVVGTRRSEGINAGAAAYASDAEQ